MTTKRTAELLADPSLFSHRGIPPFAGLCTYAEASRPGLPVEESVRRLKRHHYAFLRLHGILLARLTAEPVHELKMAFSLHAHLCAEIIADLRRRVGEMREPPLGLDKVPDPSLEVFFDEILAAPSTGELLFGLYEKALPALQAALARHLADTNLLVDAPSVRVIRHAQADVAGMLAFGADALAALLPETARAELAQWATLLDVLLISAGGLDGTGEAKAAAPTRHFSNRPFVYDPVPRRDARFDDPYNAGVNAEVLLYDEQMPVDAKVLAMYLKRLREIDVPEMMAGIISQTKDRPWEYYRDMTRQLWDEARHALMGEVGFLAAGLDWRKAKINFTWSLQLNTQLQPLERHGVLYFIEQGLMPRTGKRYEWEVARQSDQPLAALFQDYDWADEVLHARVGRDWYVTQFPTATAAVEFGDQCWSKVLFDWKAWRDEGRTRHRNWWPEVYREYCAQRGREPDARALAYDTSYEAIRADLKPLPTSG